MTTHTLLKLPTFNNFPVNLSKRGEKEKRRKRNKNVKPAELENKTVFLTDFNLYPVK